MHRKSLSPGRIVAFAAPILAWIVLGLLPLGDSGAASSGLPQRHEAQKSVNPMVRVGLERLDRVVVKFHEGTQIRLRGSVLTSLDPGVRMGSMEAWLAQHPDIQVARHFSMDESALDLERTNGESVRGWRLADLNLYYEFRLPAVVQTPSSVSAIIAELRAIPLVETAFVEPIPQPAALQTATGRSVPPPQAPPLPPTPDFAGQQGYLYASPSGVNAQAVWGYPGGRGALVRLLDIEGAWLWTHEDLKSPFFTAGTPIEDPSWRNHGTAVMGEMVGQSNGFGVAGIASDLQVGGVSIGSMGVADAINTAATNEAIGDLFLIELHAPGPNANGSGQYGYVPMEFWQDNFDAIQTAVANGRICIQAAGNGEQNLDDPVYQGLFDRTNRNSGAIMVGAGTPSGLDAEWFTNYGSRLDLNGWGDAVTTTGYGDLQGGAETQWYTSWFSGTSSASPIVAGSVASLQGMSKARWGIPLNGPLAAQILFDTGTPWVGVKRIGNRPNLVAARTMLLQGIGTISGTVRDAVTSLPIPGARVLVVERNILLLTDANGNYRIPVRSGTYTLRASEFFHETGEQAVTVGAGQSVILSFTLAPAPTGYLAGSVIDARGALLAGATVRVLNTPIPTAQTDATGSYTVPGIPVATGYDAVFGLVPAHGAAWRPFSIAWGTATIANPILVDAQTFEGSDGGYTGDPLWQWGAPTGGIGPSGGFSGTNCWGTNLSGNYPDNAVAYLTSPAFDFHTATTLFLSFTHYYDSESGFDGGNVEVKIGSDWVTLVPKGGYPMEFLGGLGNEDGYSGYSGGWQPAVFDLTLYIGSAVQFRFHFGSDSGVNGPGWYIDDVAFDAGEAPAGIADAHNMGRVTLMPARPNPFRDATEIGFATPVGAASARLRIIDPNGRIVRELYNGPAAAGARSIRWDGMDGSGRVTPAGVYFYILEADGRTIGRRPIVRIR